MTNVIRLLPALLLVALLIAPGGSFAREGDSAVFSLQPVRYDPERPATQSYFIYDAHSGQRFTDEVRIRNTGTHAGTARLYPVDATTGQNSGPVYLSQADPRHDVGAWMKLEQTEVSLGPGEERIIRFTVAVPPDARPGQHLGALVAEDIKLKQGNTQGALQINLQRRMALAVQVNLPGPVVEKLVLTNVESAVQQGYQLLLLGLRNDGSEMVKATGTLRVTDAAGQEVQQLALTLDSLLPETEIDYPVPVATQALAAGDYHAVVDLTYGKQGTVHYETTFTITSQQVAQVYTAAGQQLPPLAPGATLAPALNGTPRLMMVLALFVSAAMAITVFIRKRRAT
ncbi:MAG: hypothetical protein CYG59_19565 [Chloroflexi bacterium]|nr:MAG: hypothetical protein CYG59_19565 [Chloroflexota bacterium]